MNLIKIELIATNKKYIIIIKSGLMGICIDFDSQKERLKKERKLNYKYALPLKIKIIELCAKREKAKPFICAYGGNHCNNPCYEYQEKLAYNCPKCGGAVKKDFENGKIIKHIYNEEKGESDEMIYYDDNVCTEFNWVDDYDEIDMNTTSLLNFFVRREIKDKNNWVEYLFIDGHRFNAPPNTLFKNFLMENNDFFFPKTKLPIFYIFNNLTIYKRESNNNTCFFYDKIKDELGQSLGFYGYKWKHFVSIFTCIKCKYKYHILRTSPFKYRDKSLDIYIDNPVKL